VNAALVVLVTIAIFVGASSLDTAKRIIKSLNSSGNMTLTPVSLKQAKLDAMTDRKRKLDYMRERFLATGVAFDSMTFIRVHGRYAILNALWYVSLQFNHLSQLFHCTHECYVNLNAYTVSQNVSTAYFYNSLP
jgi:hypothetical protein